MATYNAQADLPYTPQQVFDLVADIESYPQFLHHLALARIRRQKGNTLWVDQVVRFAMLRLKFSTRAVLEPPMRLRVVCHDPLFGTFDEVWSFTAMPSGGTRLGCHATYEVRSALLRLGLGAALPGMLATTVKGFEARARQLYGQAG
jgi:coenzyme Q-binding protein COQ10